MAVLSDVDLRKAMEENEGIIIMNLREESITGVGYDLTIGFICDADTGKIPDLCEDDENRYTLLPGRRYLVISKEYIFLSSQYMATLHSRGSYALKGIGVSSTTIDPNYEGCVYMSLINCTFKKINIKKDNQFVTMVIHELCTSTDIVLQKNERKMRKNTQETFNSRFSNLHAQASKAAMLYVEKLSQEVRPEYEKAKQKMYEKDQIKRKSFTSDQETIKRQNNQQSANSIKDLNKDSNDVMQTKNVTFFIGNGFDLNVGLHTRYADFYNFYIERYPDDMLAKEIEGNYENWADLELELGNYTKKIQLEDEEAFWMSEDNMEQALRQYLKFQMERIRWLEISKKKQIAIEVRDSLEEFYKNFPEVEKRKFKEILKSVSNNIEYSFITFNYTDVLEKCLDAVKSEFLYEIGTHRDDKGTQYYHRPGEMIYIHGTIANEMILGVNDESQIANIRFRENILCKQTLIKEETNKRYGNARIKRACNIIDNSIVICIFGMSIGETDKMWWQYIASWLRESQDRRLVIFARGSGGKHEIFGTADRMLEKFKNNANVLNDEWEWIKDQICVEVNSNIFNLKLV